MRDYDIYWINPIQYGAKPVLALPVIDIHTNKGDEFMKLVVKDMGDYYEGKDNSPHYGVSDWYDYPYDIGSGKSNCRRWGITITYEEGTPEAHSIDVDERHILVCTNGNLFACNYEWWLKHMHACN